MVEVQDAVLGQVAGQAVDGLAGHPGPLEVGSDPAGQVRGTQQGKRRRPVGITGGTS
jgi:hypothetical protein